MVLITTLIVTGIVYTVWPESQKINIHVILGSTRQGRLSDKIAQAFIDDLKHRTDIRLEAIDLRTFNIPFLNDAIAPSNRKTITDPLIAAWSEKISKADAYVIIVPEYNAGYPGELKNAFDILYKEWNNKPVAFVGYSGGPSGGASAISQLRTVAQGLKMVPVFDDIKIPYSRNALDNNGSFTDANIMTQLHSVIENIVDYVRKNKQY